MYKLEYFYYVVEIAKVGSINRAAQNLYISQPYLSLCIKKIEEILKIKIFNRTNKGVVPTEAGEEFIKYCNRIIALVDNSNDLHKIYSSKTKNFKITTMPSFTMLDIFHGFEYICESKNEYDIFYEEVPNTLIPEMVMKGMTDIGIVYTISNKHDIEIKNFEKMSLNFVPLISEPIYVVISIHNKLYNNNEVDLKELKNLDFLVENIKLFPSLPPVENNPLPEIFKKNNNLKFNNNRSMLYYLTKSSNSFCIGQKSLNLTNPFVNSGHLRYIAISDLNLHSTTGYLTNENKDSSDIEESFINYIENYYNVT